MKEIKQKVDRAKEDRYTLLENLYEAVSKTLLVHPMLQSSKSSTPVVYVEVT